jgi:hypothetical protein
MAESTALRLADALNCATDDDCGYCQPCVIAAELRRLHVVNQQLLEVLDEIAADHAYWPDIEKQIRAAIARAEEQA